MRFWLHRISHESKISYPLLEMNYLSIGWSTHANKTDIAKAMLYNANEKEFQRYMAMTEDGSEKLRSRRSLWNFLQFRIGDIIVVPLYGGKFSIVEVAGLPEPISQDLKAKLNRMENLPKTYDIGFVCGIKPIQMSLKRSTYADAALTSRMKMRQTNGNISDLAESVSSVMDGKRVDLYVDAKEALANELLRLIIEKLDANRFEQLIAWYFRKLGASAEIPAKNDVKKGVDSDADIIASFETLKTIIYVQAKKHEGQTNEWAITQIRNYTDQKLEYIEGYTLGSWVITTGETFSEQAIAEARAANVLLMNGMDFAQALVEVGISNLDQAFKLDTMIKNKSK